MEEWQRYDFIQLQRCIIYLQDTWWYL